MSSDSIESPDSESPDVPPIEVKITNKDKAKQSIYDSADDPEYDEFIMTVKDIEEFENGDT